MATVIVPVGIVILVILVALFFDFLNGFHDAANSVATIVSTRVLSPRIAVLWAAFFNFVAAFVFGVNVASTIGKGTIDPAIVTAWLLLSTLIGAISWDIITWWFGLPTSSSHALVGGLIGAGVVKGGWGVVQVSGVSKIILFIALSPLIGLLLAIGLILLTSRIGAKFSRSTADHAFRRLQLVSAALYSLGHGTNDAQKTMGIIAALLFAQGLLGAVFFVPFYVILSSNHGHENNKTTTLRRIQRRNRRSHDPFRNSITRNTGKHDPHYRWRDNGSWFHTPFVRSKMGRC